MVLCIGPMLAIPRTAATTYETSVAPLLSGVSPVVFSIVFFLLVFLLCVRETAWWILWAKCSPRPCWQGSWCSLS